MIHPKIRPTALRSTVILAASLMSFFAGAGEPDVPWGKLRDLAGRYLAACSTPEGVRARERKLKERTAQRMKDNAALDEDSAMRSLMLDWAAANDGKIRRKEKEAVTQACFYFVAFIDRGYLVPQQIRSRLTPDVVKEITDYLEGQIAAAGTASKQQQ